MSKSKDRFVDGDLLAQEDQRHSDDVITTGFQYPVFTQCFGSEVDPQKCVVTCAPFILEGLLTYLSLDEVLTNVSSIGHGDPSVKTSENPYVVYSITVELASKKYGVLCGYFGGYSSQVPMHLKQRKTPPFDTMATINDQTFATQMNDHQYALFLLQVTCHRQTIEEEKFCRNTLRAMDIQSLASKHERSPQELVGALDVIPLELMSNLLTEGAFDAEVQRLRYSLEQAQKSQESRPKAQGGFFEEAWQTPGKVNDAADSIKQFISVIQDKIEEISKYLAIPDFDVVLFTTSVYAFVQAVCERNLLSAGIAGVSLARQLGLKLDFFTELWTIVTEILESGIFYAGKVLAQSEMSFDWVGSILMAVITALAKGKMPDHNTLTTLLSDFGRAAIGFTKATELVTWLYKHARICYYTYVLEQNVEELDREEAYPTVTRTLETVELLQSSEFKLQYLDRSKDLCKAVIELAATIETLKNLAFSKKDTALHACLSTKLVSINKLATYARNSSAFCKSTKIAPTAVFLYGKPGVGKSVLIEYMKFYLWSKHYSSTAWTASDLSFTKAPSSEYWDGYSGQPIICYDDIFQVKDSQNSPNPEYLEIIKIVNESPFHLNMSGVDDKKNCYMEADFVLASSNANTINPTSITSPDAVIRRFSMAYDVRVKDDFQVSTLDPKLDVQKVATYMAKHGRKGFCPETYELVEIDLKTGNPTGTPSLDVNDFLSKLETIHAAKQTASADLADSFATAAGLPAPKEVQGFDQFYAKMPKAQMDVDSKPVKIVHVSTEYIDKLADEIEHGIYEEQEQDVVIYPQVNVNGFVANHIELQLNAEDKEIFEECEEDEYDTFFRSTKAGKRTFEAARATWKYLYTSKVGRFMRRLYKNAEIKVNYDNIKNTCKYIYAKIWNFFSNQITIDSVLTGLARGAIIYAIKCMIQRMFVSCEIRKFNTLYQFSNYDGKCTCGDCKDIFRMEKVHQTVGSTAHGLGFLKYCIDHYECVEAKTIFPRIYVANAKRVIAESLYPDGVSMRPKTLLNAESVYPDGHVSRCVSKNVNAEAIYPDGTVVRARSINAAESYPGIIGVDSDSNLIVDPAYVAKTLNVKVERNKRPVAQFSDNQMLEQHEAVVRTNMVIVLSNGIKVNGLFVTGRVMLLPLHFWMVVGSEFIVQNPFMSLTSRILKSACKSHTCKDISGMSVDLVLVELPLSVPSRRNIVNLFAAAHTHEIVSEGSLVVAGMRLIGEYPTLVSFHSHKFQTHSKEIEYESPGGIHKVSSYVEYDVDTKPGDCGAIIFVRNKGMLGKILGVHVAGLSGEGFGAIVSREFLMRNMEQITESRSLVDAKVPFAEMTTVSHTYETPKLAGDYVSLGNLPTPKSSTVTRIAPSLIAGAVAAVTMMPAFLRKVGNIDPMKKGIQKVLNTQAILPSTLLDIAANDVMNVHNTDGKKVVYGFEEGVIGDVENGFNAINRSTSPGYPYCLNNPGQGKRHWLGTDEYVMNEEIKKDVNDLIENAKQNKRSDVVYIATLKDERRPIEKVMQGKTRVFAAAPMHYVIAMRQYFGAFIAHIQKNKIDNEVGVGTNVYGMDWHKTGKRLQEKGEAIIAGDFSNFDGSLHQEILWKVLDIINKWYGGTSEETLVRRVLFEDVCNARILVDGEIVHMTHSQPSGNPMTVIINSIFNQIVMRMAYLDLKAMNGGTVECDFRKEVSMQTFGDDNVLNISSRSIEWYNQITITDSLAKFGLTYTDEGKTGDLVPSRSLWDIQYLKRKFEIDDCGMFKAPLQMDVIHEMCNWVKGTTQPRESLKQNVETAFTELALYGKDIYDLYVDKYVKACKAVNVSINAPSYYEIDDFHYSQKFGISKYV